MQTCTKWQLLVFAILRKRKYRTSLSPSLSTQRKWSRMWENFSNFSLKVLFLLHLCEQNYKTCHTDEKLTIFWNSELWKSNQQLITYSKSTIFQYYLNYRGFLAKSFLQPSSINEMIFHDNQPDPETIHQIQVEPWLKLFLLNDQMDQSAIQFLVYHNFQMNHLTSCSRKTTSKYIKSWWHKLILIIWGQNFVSIIHQSQY